MSESVQASESANSDSMPSAPTIDTTAAIRRYIQIQREIAHLEREKEQLRDALVKELEGKAPARWRADGRCLSRRVSENRYALHLGSHRECGSRVAPSRHAVLKIRSNQFEKSRNR